MRWETNNYGYVDNSICYYLQNNRVLLMEVVAICALPIKQWVRLPTPQGPFWTHKTNAYSKFE